MHEERAKVWGVAFFVLAWVHLSPLRGAAVGGTNIQGEDQKKLDVIANELFINMLKSSFEVSHTSTTPIQDTAATSLQYSKLDSL